LADNQFMILLLLFYIRFLAQFNLFGSVLSPLHNLFTALCLALTPQIFFLFLFSEKRSFALFVLLKNSFNSFSFFII
jgi:hypothetical protein